MKSFQTIATGQIGVNEEYAEVGACLIDALNLRNKYVFEIPKIDTPPPTSVAHTVLPVETKETFQIKNGVFLVFSEVTQSCSIGRSEG